MNKLSSTLLAGTAALMFAGAAFGADQTDPQRRDNQTQAQPNAPDRKPDQGDAQRAQQNQAPAGAQQGQGSNTPQAQTPNQAGQAGADEGNMGRNPNQPGGEVSAKEKEYLADLEKCEAMSGAQKKSCVDMAKKRHGDM